MEKELKLDDMRQEQVDNLLKNLPPEVEQAVELPSKGKFYNLTEPVVVRPMTFDDEKAIISSGKGQVDALALLLSRCVKNVNVAELLTMDRMFLFIKIRELSYGPDYHVSITCPNCGILSDVALDIREFPINEIPDDFEDPREITLPVIGKKIKLKFPRAKDEIYFKDTDILSQNLWRFVESIEDITDKPVISKVITMLQSGNALEDIHTIIREINRPDFGIETKFQFGCGECSQSTLMEVPIGEDFFIRK